MWFKFSCVTDGSEDGDIHCLKKHLSISTGAALLKQGMEALDEDHSSEDPFKISEYVDNKCFHVTDGDIDIMWDDFYL